MAIHSRAMATGNGREMATIMDADLVAEIRGRILDGEIGSTHLLVPSDYRH